MPAGLVKTENQEQLWHKAGRAAFKSLTQSESKGAWSSIKEKLDKLNGWGLTMHIYKKMLKKRNWLPDHLESATMNNMNPLGNQPIQVPMQSNCDRCPCCKCTCPDCDGTESVQTCIAVIGVPAHGMLNFYEVQVMNATKLKRTNPYDQVFTGDWTRVLAKFLQFCQNSGVDCIDLSIDRSLGNRVPNRGVWRGLMDQMGVQIQGCNYFN